MPSSIQTFGGSAGIVPSEAIKRTAQIINTIIPANSTLPIFQAGLAFYVIAASAPVQIRPAGGTFNSYYTGTGVRADPLNAFDLLEVQNRNAASVTLSLWVGFGDYIDNRLITVSDLFFPIAFPTYPVAAAAVDLLVPDRSGTAIVDINGVTWLALNRISILITNFDTVNPIPLKDLANAVGAVFSCLPNTSAVLELAGDYRVTLGATPLNMILSEVYNCISPTLGP
jgi:hypothetical protein